MQPLFTTAKKQQQQQQHKTQSHPAITLDLDRVIYPLPVERRAAEASARLLELRARYPGDSLWRSVFRLGGWTLGFWGLGNFVCAAACVVGCWCRYTTSFLPFGFLAANTRTHTSHNQQTQWPRNTPSSSSSGSSPPPPSSSPRWRSGGSCPRYTFEHNLVYCTFLFLFLLCAHCRTNQPEGLAKYPNPPAKKTPNQYIASGGPLPRREGPRGRAARHPRRHVALRPGLVPRCVLVLYIA